MQFQEITLITGDNTMKKGVEMGSKTTPKIVIPSKSIFIPNNALPADQKYLNTKFIFPSVPVNFSPKKAKMSAINDKDVKDILSPPNT
jgi:hypothetical protein